MTKAVNTSCQLSKPSRGPGHTEQGTKSLTKTEVPAWPVAEAHSPVPRAACSWSCSVLPACPQHRSPATVARSNESSGWFGWTAETPHLLLCSSADQSLGTSPALDPSFIPRGDLVLLPRTPAAAFH